MSFETIRLEKGMYNVPGGITAALEQLDPSENYKDTPLAGLDAYQRQLKRFDIKVAGSNSDVIAKFFSTTDSAALFPEFISRAVATGITGENLLPEIVATTTHIDSIDYRSIVSDISDDAKALQEVAEGAAIPETSVSTRETLVTLKKRGRMLTASYEALKFQRLDLFTVTLKQIGAYIARQQFNDAVDVLKADATGITADGTTLSYAELISLWNGLDPYQLNGMIVSPNMVKALLNLPQFQNPDTGINFAGTGRLTSLMGARLFKSDKVDDQTILGFDKNYALEMVVAQDVTVDYDRLIDRQLERAAITTIAGFSKIFNEAVLTLTV
ncbi:MAG: phage major capsid protein [Clostridia bacterium]|nr:phage major capsid protein [Clostridia bacterium]